MESGSEKDLTAPVYAKDIKYEAEAFGDEGGVVVIFSENIPAAGSKTYVFTGTFQNPHYHLEG